MPGLKDNPSTLHQLAQGRLSAAIPDERVSDWEMDHGRVEPRRLALAIRGHWSVEIMNPWRRDTSLWKEDASRPRKKPSGGQVLALPRGAVLRFHDAEAFESLNAGFHHHSAKPHAALRLIKTPPPQVN